MIQKEITAKCLVKVHESVTEGEVYEGILTTQGGSPELEVAFEVGVIQRYPSKKRFNDDWEIITEKVLKAAKVVNMKVAKARAGKKQEISNADAGAIIYTELLSAINRFNEQSKQTYSGDNAYKLPVFTVKLDQVVYDEATQAQTQLYGAGVLKLEITQFGLKHMVHNDGVSFRSKKELDNINAYAPNLYLGLLSAMVETALMSMIALNPDNPDVNKEVPSNTTDS